MPHIRQQATNTIFRRRIACGRPGSQTVLPREVWLYPSRPCEIHGTQHVVWIKQIISKMLRFIHFSPKLLFPRALNRHKTSIQQASTPQHNSNLKEFHCQVSHIWGSKGACIQLVEMLLAVIGAPSRPQEPEYGKPPGGSCQMAAQMPSGSDPRSPGWLCGRDRGPNARSIRISARPAPEGRSHQGQLGREQECMDAGQR